uniref:NADH dehydrogenase subunit 6 n=1 Tax=Calantica studeri TaxID=2977347 RepID=UPI0021CD14E0|nr:NADH dehydrogenase subunit 6 [Calantica studeri]UWM12853.1 NADH dehydrogenase subunit 6 [Calantica studeri]
MMLTIFAMNLVFLFMFHPLALILILIIQSLLTSMLIFCLTHFPWFSYTLILIFLGGMLILFTYMSNIASNEMFKPNLKIFLPFLTLPPLVLLLNLPAQNMSMESMPIFSDHFSNLIIFKPFTPSITTITILMASYILLTLLGIVKISKMSHGPLRIS